MAIKLFTNRSFGGGFVSSLDPALLPPYCSPAMSNFDVSSTDALTRRDGYGSLTASAMKSASVHALARGYFTTHQWLAICGTALYSMPDGARDVPLTRKELSLSNITGTATTLSLASYSGGSAISTLTTVSATAPYCSSVVVSIPSQAASAKVDAGAWVSATATWRPTITATTHTFSFKPKAANGKSLSVTSAGGVCHRHATAGVKQVSLSFYDDGSTPAGGKMGVRFTTEDNGVAGSGVACGISAGVGVYVYGTQGTGTPRSTGWHTFDLTADGHITLDGAAVTQLVCTGILHVGAYSSSWNAATYFDRYCEDYRCVDDMDDATGWTVDSGTWSASTTQKVTTPLPLIIDYIEYSANGSWTKRDGTLSATAQNFAVEYMGGKAYFASPYDAVQSWNGTTVAAVSASGSMAGASFLKAFKNRLFATGKIADPALLEWTPIGQPEKWVSAITDGAGYMRVTATGDGSVCTGFEELAHKLIWYSNSSIHAITCDGVQTGWRNDEVSDKFGCIAPKSLAVAPSSHIFMAADGVRTYGSLANLFSNDGTGISHISKFIQPTIDAYTNAQRIAACGAYYKDRYYLAIGSDVLVCDPTRSVKIGKDTQPVWVKYAYSGLTITSLYTTENDDAYALYAGASDGKVYRLDYGQTDNGAAIASSYTTPPIALGSYVTTKHFRGLDIAADGGNATQSLTITPATDDLNGTTQTVTLDAATDIQPVHTELNARGRALSLTLTSSGALQPLSISELTVRYQPPRVR